jgi:hypothetical protein
LQVKYGVRKEGRDNSRPAVHQQYTNAASQ